MPLRRRSTSFLAIFAILAFSASEAHPLVMGKGFAHDGEASKWRPFNSMDTMGKNRILPIAYMTMNEEENPVHPAILHGYQYEERNEDLKDLSHFVDGLKSTLRSEISALIGTNLNNAMAGGAPRYYNYRDLSDKQRRFLPSQLMG